MEVIGAVEGGDEGAAGAPGGGAGAPRRRARPRVHDVDLVLADQLDQRVRVAADLQRRLRGERQGDMGNAVAVKLAHHGAPRGSHQGPAAGRRDGDGDIDRAAFDPSRLQCGQHLQDAHAVQVDRTHGMTQWGAGETAAGGVAMARGNGYFPTGARPGLRSRVRSRRRRQLKPKKQAPA